MKKIFFFMFFLIAVHSLFATDPWINKNLDPNYSFSKIKFIDSSTGFIQGSYVLLKTTDAGQNWQELISLEIIGTTNYIKYFDIFSDGNGFKIETNGKFSKTADFCSTWTDSQLPSTYKYMIVSNLNKDMIWIAGDDRTLLFTTNGGDMWDSTIINKFENVNLFGDLCFVDSLTGFIATDKGSLLQTTDGGKTWFEKSTGINKYLYEINFIDKKNVWIGGMGGTIIRTTDGGENWMQITSPSTEDIVKIWFVDDKEGYVTTITSSWGGGKIYYTSDGGNSWNFQHEEANAIITGFHFFSKDKGWACGNNEGLLLYMDKTSSVEENINEMIEKRTVFLFSDKKSYPMPASSTVRSTIYWNDNYYFIENAKIEVYTSFGEKISNPEISIEKLAPYQANIVWNCGVYAPGIYFIRVTLADETVSIPIMVSR